MRFAHREIWRAIDGGYQCACRERPIHPMLVVFPTGLWIFSLVCDVVHVTGTPGDAWATVALYRMVGGLVGALRPAVPGFIDLLFYKGDATPVRNVPAGSANGRRLPLKGKGIPWKTLGDLYVILTSCCHRPTATARGRPTKRCGTHSTSIRARILRVIDHERIGDGLCGRPGCRGRHRVHAR